MTVAAEVKRAFDEITKWNDNLVPDIVWACAGTITQITLFRSHQI